MLQYHSPIIKKLEILNWQPSHSYEKMFKDAWNTVLKNK